MSSAVVKRLRLQQLQRLQHIGATQCFLEAKRRMLWLTHSTDSVQRLLSRSSHCCSSLKNIAVV